jgi:hypothetical protein
MAMVTFMVMVRRGRAPAGIGAAPPAFDTLGMAPARG